MKIKITADSVIDLRKEQIEENNISLVSLFINLGEQEFIDGVTVNPSDIYSYVEKTNVLPKTAARSSVVYKEFFEGFLNDGYDAVIHFDISSDMSGSHQNAVTGAKDLPNVYVIDSRSLSSGVGLSVLYACDLVKKGYKANEIVGKVKKRLPNVRASFVLDRLDYLHKGGRCSLLALLGSKILSIKPTIEVNNGKMGVSTKNLGSFKASVDKYVKYTLSKYNNPDYTRIFITTTVGTDENIIAAVHKYLDENTPFKEIIESHAGCTITSHCGKSTLGILYINDGGEQD